MIRESFTPLPCGGTPTNRTTVQQEGCAEQQILRTDKTINSLNKAIFAKLRDDPARRRFIAAQQAWLAYRRAYCLSLSDVFQGGSQAPCSTNCAPAGSTASTSRTYDSSPATLAPADGRWGARLVVPAARVYR